MDDAKHFSIGEVARSFDIRVSTLRYYDELGLLPPAERRGNVRYYGLAEMRRLALIQRLHHGGLVSLADTARLISDAPGSNGSTGREVLTGSIESIAARIEELTQAQRILEHFLSCPRTDPVRECPHLREDLDETVAAALGEG